ncbi:MAG: hypothetical protein LBU81_00745, partial [Methanosarcinales archaeon]|nr:hypothetical protein [Methanosarcinales archaeon]
MKDSKIRRTSPSSVEGDSKYKDYSSLPTDSQKEPADSERFFVSVQRKELTPVKKAYVESTRTKPDAPFAGAQPKGMYFTAGTAVVDDYASRTDWRDRIQKAIEESESRTKTPVKEPTPWPEAPAGKTGYHEKIYEEKTPSKKEADDDILWEIDEKITSGKSVPKEVKSESKTLVRAEAYTAWLAARSIRLDIEEAKLKENAAVKAKKQKQAAEYEKWTAEREERIAAEEAKLKETVATKSKKQKQAAEYEKWVAEREERIAAEETKLKETVAARLKKQKQAAEYEKWTAEREERIAAEETKLKETAAAKAKKQKQTGK